MCASEPTPTCADQASSENLIDQRGDGEADSRADRRGRGGDHVGRWAWRPPRKAGGRRVRGILADVLSPSGRRLRRGARAWERRLRWRARGIGRHRLEALLQRDAPGAVDEAIRRVRRGRGRLKSWRRRWRTWIRRRGPERVPRPRAAERGGGRGQGPRGTPAAASGPSGGISARAFAVGPSNQVAVSAARAASSGRGRSTTRSCLVGEERLGQDALAERHRARAWPRGKRAVVACLSTQAVHR